MAEPSPWLRLWLRCLMSSADSVPFDTPLATKGDVVEVKREIDEG